MVFLFKHYIPSPKCKIYNFKMKFMKIKFIQLLLLFTCFSIFSQDKLGNISIEYGAV